MAADFSYDVFLSHSTKDKEVVRAVAERLRSDGLRVWFDDWEIRPGDNFSTKIEDGLEYSRVLVLCMTASAFDSDWAQLEAGTFRFRDPLNKERRFIPLRLDETSIKASLRDKSEKPTIVCSDCERRVPLWDDLEQHFASEEIKQRVRELEEQSAIVLDNESKERALVGEVISTVALAGQICREKNVSDHGIDVEIELKNDHNEATGEMLFLQLKSGDSSLRERSSDGAEIFKVKDERHVRYWMNQKFPVLLVIRNSKGETRWMEVRDWLKRASDNGKKPVKQIVFEGERLDVMSVRRWREKMLGFWRA